MGETVKLIECPRDAWQGLPKTIPAEVDNESVAKAQKQLENTKVKLARQNAGTTKE